MQAKRLGKSLNSHRLNELIAPLRATDNVTNWFYIVADYAALALILGGAIGFFEHRAAWGLSALLEYSGRHLRGHRRRHGPASVCRPHARRGSLHPVQESSA